MTLLNPYWLILLLPVLLAAWQWKSPSRMLKMINITAMLTVVFALAGPVLHLRSQGGVLVVLADRSASMPQNVDAAHKELIDILQSHMTSRDRIKVISLAKKPLLEAGAETGRFAGFAGEVNRNGTNMAGAIEMALATIPAGTPGKILILSDGVYTGKNPAAVAPQALERGIAIDYRHTARSRANDLAVENISVPLQAAPGETFMINAWVSSNINREVEFELLRGRQIIASGKRVLKDGMNSFTFRDRAPAGGLMQYEFSVKNADDKTPDPTPENNVARAILEVRAVKPVACVSESGKSSLTALLKRGNVAAVDVAGEKFDTNIASLSCYSAVILENLPSSYMGVDGMANLADWVSQAGGGLVLTGGANAYGPGGYFKSPLDPILPVSMELRKEHRKFAMSIVVVLDRSGSMAMSAGGGKTKMDLADLSAVEVLKLLSPMDEFACIAVDSSPHLIVPLKPVTNKSAISSSILRIHSEGGGIFVYTGLKEAAAVLAKSGSGTKHIILFADAADAEEPGDYKNLLDKCRRAGISCSVIGLGQKTDCDAAFLMDVAKRGGGRCFFTDKPSELPRLFAQDTFSVARSAFVKEPAKFHFVPGNMYSITSMNFGTAPTLGGFNLCYLRDGASLCAVSDDEYKAPILATWQARLGRVACFTGEAEGKYAGKLPAWPMVGDFFASLGRWAAGADSKLPADMLVTQTLDKGLVSVSLHLDPARKGTPFDQLPTLHILAGKPGEPPIKSDLPMRWTNADELVAEFELDGDETAIATVDVPKVGRETCPPVCLPYSPEHQPSREGAGLLNLQKLADITGGRNCIDIEGIWQTIPKYEVTHPMDRWLLLTAAVLVLVGALQRRTNLLGDLRLPSLKISLHRGEKSKEHKAKRGKKKTPASDAAEEKPQETVQTIEKVKEEPASDDNAKLRDALNMARKRAKRR